MKATDPQTALTKTAIRRMVTTGALPSVKVGQKYLVALENLDAYLGGQPEREEVHDTGVIRPVRGVPT